MFSPNVKVGYDVTKVVNAGFEYYGSLGPVTGFDPLRDQHTADLRGDGFEFQQGLGVQFRRGHRHDGGHRSSDREDDYRAALRRQEDLNAAVPGSRLPAAAGARRASGWCAGAGIPSMRLAAGISICCSLRSGGRSNRATRRTPSQGAGGCTTWASRCRCSRGSRRRSARQAKTSCSTRDAAMDFTWARSRAKIGFEAHGVDISTAAVDAAAKRYPECEWIVANADLLLPFADRSFSLVLSITARMNAREFRRVLRDDGRLLVAIPAPDDFIELRGAGRDRVEGTVETFGGEFKLTEQRRVTTSAELDADAVRDALHSIYRPLRVGRPGGDAGDAEPGSSNVRPQVTFRSHPAYKGHEQSVGRSALCLSLIEKGSGIHGGGGVCRWRWGSARTRRFSRCSTRSCCGCCR